MDTRTSRTIGLAFAIAILILVTIAVISFLNLQRVQAETALVAHTHSVLTGLKDLIGDLRDVQRQGRGFILEISPAGRHAMLDSASAEIGESLAQLDSLLADSDFQKRNLAQIRPLSEQLVQYYGYLLGIVRTRGQQQGLQVLREGHGNKLIDAAEDIIAVMERHEQDLLKERQAMSDGETRRMIITLGVGSTVSIVLFVIAFAALRREITERQRAEHRLGESEERYRRLFESARDGIVVIDYPTGNIVDVNPFLCSRLGYSREQIVGRGLWSLAAGGQAAVARAAIETVKERGEARSEDLPLVTATGEELHTELVGTLYATHGQPLIQCTIRDVTERRQADVQLKATMQQLVEKTNQLSLTNRELEAFSYSVSHDLRAPLRAIDGFASMLEQDHAAQLNTDAQRIIGVIRTNTAVMGNLIDDLLEFSRITKTDLKRVTTDMTSLAESVAREQQSTAGPSATLTVHPLPPARVDPPLIRQVIVNLLSNAVKFSRTRPAQRIDVRGWVEEERIVYSVADNGIGFDMKFRDKIFGVFERLHPHEQFEGTGVGLALVQRIIERHGGSVWANAAPGTGATFYFSIPS